MFFETIAKFDTFQFFMGYLLYKVRSLLAVVGRSNNLTPRSLAISNWNEKFLSHCGLLLVPPIYNEGLATFQ